MKKIIFIILIVSLFLLGACSVSEETSENGIQYAPTASSGVLSSIKSALGGSSSTTTIPSLTSKEKEILNSGYLYETKYVVDGNKLNVFVYYNIQEFAQMEEFSQLSTKIQTQSDIAIQIQTEVNGAMQQLDELISQMMMGYDSSFSMPIEAGSAQSGAVYGVTYGSEGDYSEQTQDRDTDNDGIQNKDDPDADNDDIPNSDDDDDDNDDVSDDEDNYPLDGSRSITAESEGGYMLSSGRIDTNGDGDTDDPGESDGGSSGSGSGNDDGSNIYFETMDALIESITSQIETTQFVSYAVANNFKSGTSYLNTAAIKSFNSVESQGEIAQGYVKSIKVVEIKTI